jgi:hypothetical protein
VYQIRSEFSSMCNLSQCWIEFQAVGKNETFEKTETGINIEYFIKNCPFLVGCLP